MAVRRRRTRRMPFVVVSVVWRGRALPGPPYPPFAVILSAAKYLGFAGEYLSASETLHFVQGDRIEGWSSFASLSVGALLPKGNGRIKINGRADRSVCPTDDGDKQPIPVTLNAAKGLGCGQMRWGGTEMLRCAQHDIR